MDWKEWINNISQFPEVQKRIEGSLETLISVFYRNCNEYVVEKFVKSFTDTIRLSEACALLMEGIHASQVSKLRLFGEYQQIEYMRKHEAVKNRVLSEVSRQVRHYSLFLSHAGDEQCTDYILEQYKGTRVGELLVDIVNIAKSDVSTAHPAEEVKKNLIMDLIKPLIEEIKLLEK